MPPSRSIVRKIGTALGLGPRRQLLVAEAAASMLAARLSLALFPFRRVARGIGTFVPPTDPRVAAQAQDVDTERAEVARSIGWAVRTMAPWMPFRSVCLQQAIAAHAMLRRRGIPAVMHFGAGKSDAKPLDAHAWLDAAGVKVTGYPIARHITELGCFV